MLRLLLTMLACTAIPATAQQAVCTPAAGPYALPGSLFETSGLARGVRDTTVFWTHNDGAEPRLHALDGRGAHLGEVRVPVRLVDWEDIESTRCDGEPCLLLADIGDNAGARASVWLHEVSEPPVGGEAVVLRSLELRYPDGAQDAEALFSLPGRGHFLVTKGRHGPITLYRIPAAGSGDVLVLERVRELGPRPRRERDRVTGANASPDGAWVAIRSYRTLRLFTAEALLAGGAPAAEYDLGPLGEEQGESVVIDGAGAVWLTSESEQRVRGPVWARVTCPQPARPR